MDRDIETEADQTLKRKQSDTEQRSCSTGERRNIATKKPKAGIRFLRESPQVVDPCEIRTLGKKGVVKE